jgi:hypothetical protein
MVNCELVKIQITKITLTVMPSVASKHAAAQQQQQQQPSVERAITGEMSSSCRRERTYVVLNVENSVIIKIIQQGKEVFNISSTASSPL